MIRNQTLMIMVMMIILFITLPSIIYCSSTDGPLSSSNNLQLTYYVNFSYDGFRNLTCRDEYHPCSDNDQVVNSANLELFKIVHDNGGIRLDSFTMIIMIESMRCSKVVFDFSNYTKQFEMIWKGQNGFFDACPDILASASSINEFTIENGIISGTLNVQFDFNKLTFKNCTSDIFYLYGKVDEMIISNSYFGNNVKIAYVKNLAIENSRLLGLNILFDDKANLLIENSTTQGYLYLENFHAIVIRNSNLTNFGDSLGFSSKFNLGGEIIFSNVVTNVKTIFMSVEYILMDRVMIHDTNNLNFLYQFISVSHFKLENCSIKNNQIDVNLISMQMVQRLTIENCKIYNNSGSFLSFLDSTFGKNTKVHVENSLFEDNLYKTSLLEFLTETSYASFASFKYCKFIGNKGGNKGTIHIEGWYLQLIDSEFISNNSTYGGAVYIDNNSFTISNSKFLNNSAEKGGAIYYIGSSGGSFSNFICENNVASYSGGCIYSQSSIIEPISTIRNNKANHYGPNLASSIVDLGIKVEDNVGSASEIEILAGQTFELVLFPKDIYNQSTSELVDNNLIIRPTNDGDCTFSQNKYYFNHSIPIFMQIFPSQLSKPFKISFFITPNIEKVMNVKILPCPFSYSLKKSQQGYSCDYVPLTIIIPSAILVFISLFIIIGFSIYCCGIIMKKLIKLRKQERAEQEIERKFKDREFIFEDLPLLPSNSINSRNSRNSTVTSEKQQYIIPISEINILKRIGEGAMGVVYHAKWNRTDVAIKQLKTDANDEEFENEALLMSSLRHPSIVNIYGVSLTTNGKYMIVEYLENGSLDKQIYNSKIGKEILRFETKLKILIDISKGLIYLHSIKPHRIIHRDLKPGNILLDRNMRAKVGDFGLSKIVSNNSATLTANVGTLLYMAPELLSNDYKGRDRVDTFSFAIIMWELLFETAPYSNEIDESTNIFQILTKVTKGHRPSLALFESSFDSQEIDEWIEHNFKKKQINTIGKPKILELVTSYMEIMKNCWNNDPSQRPEFIEITDQLESLQNYLE